MLAIRRRAGLVPPPLLGLSADLTAEVPQLPELDLHYLVVALTARPRNEDAYRETYVAGMDRALDALDVAGQVPSRAVLVSSTSVYGAQPDGAMIDEDTPARPSDGPAQMLLEAEQLFAARIPDGTVLRLSGLYGGPPGRLQAQVLAGDITEPNRWTNRIHRADAAAAVVHLLTSAHAIGRLYVGTDDEPALFGDVAAPTWRTVSGHRPRRRPTSLWPPARGCRMRGFGRPAGCRRTRRTARIRLTLAPAGG